jgi:hypothetical protein
MALFTDGTISTLEELRGWESSIYDLASTEGIDLSQKLVLAKQEVEVELTTRMSQEVPEGLERVVVTRPLQLWHTFRTLALAYRDAYSSHLNDRYQGKWNEYERLAKWGRLSLFETGVGMVGEPVEKAAGPTLSAVVSSNAAAATYWVRVAWVSGTGAEGCPSDLAVLTASQGEALGAEATAAPSNAGGWNVYVGLELESLQMQNVSPIAIGAKWVMGVAGMVNGKKPGDGQPPEFYRRFERRLQRG